MFFSASAMDCDFRFSTPVLDSVMRHEILPRWMSTVFDCPTAAFAISGSDRLYRPT